MKKLPAYIPINVREKSHVDNMIQYILEKNDFSEPLYRRCLNKIKSDDLTDYFNKRYIEIQYASRKDSDDVKSVEKRRNRNISLNISSLNVTDKQSVDILLNMLMKTHRVEAMGQVVLNKIKDPDLKNYFINRYNKSGRTSDNCY